MMVLDPVRVTWLKLLASQQNKLDKKKGYSSELGVRPINALEDPEVFTNRHLSNFKKNC